VTLGAEAIVAVSTLLGSLSTGAITIIYWLVKMRKDLDAAHAAIRELKKKKAG
jgi:hypothetical protein